MRYGIEVAAAGECGDPRTLAELACLAEEAGWDGFFLEDYLVYWMGGAPTYDPWLALGAIALATERIRIGTTVTPLPRRRPWTRARETVALDHLSGGRVILGVGLGNGSDPDFAGLGEETDAKRRAGMLDEALDVLVGLWSGEPFEYRGKHFAVDGVTFLPRPVQHPRIPIWVGGSSRKQGPVRRAARWDGFLPVPIDTEGGGWRHHTPEDVRALRAAIARERTATTPFDLAIGGAARGEDWERERELIASLAEAGATWWLEWVPAAEPDVMRAAIARGPLRPGAAAAVNHP